MTEQTGATPFWDLERYRTGRPGADGVGPPISSGGGSGQDGPPPASGDPGRPRRKGVALAYSGDPFRLLGTALRAAFLTMLTLGLYRFWMITRLRRFYWGAVRIDGDPLEYTGRPLEKLLGFLLAVVLLAVYLGLVNLGLTYVGLSVATDDPVTLNLVLQISVLATLPLIFYATYRGQRYVLARTRWRGIRFGLDAGAVGYMLRGMALSLVTVATLGLAWPYQQFHMAKYITDRARFGDLAFEQGGSWTELFAQWIYLYILIALGALTIWGMVENPEDDMAMFLGTVVLSLGGAAIALMLQRYRVVSFRILWSHRSLGGARFENAVSAGRVIFLTIAGSIGVALGTMIVALAIGFGGYALLDGAGVLPDSATMQTLFESEDPAALAQAWPAMATLLAFYLLIFAVGYALSQVFVTSPVLAAKTVAMTLHDAERLALGRQRAHDPSAEAGGFADALGVDIGAGV